eukprot:1200273-Pleurochrysis_carterae.AAC.1
MGCSVRTCFAAVGSALHMLGQIDNHKDFKGLEFKLEQITYMCACFSIGQHACSLVLQTLACGRMHCFVITFFADFGSTLHLCTDQLLVLQTSMLKSADLRKHASDLSANTKYKY